VHYNFLFQSVQHVIASVCEAEGVLLQPSVHTVHDENEEERRDRIPLADRRKDVKGRCEAVVALDAALRAVEGVKYIRDEGLREVEAFAGGPDGESMDRVEGLPHIIGREDQLGVATASASLMKIFDDVHHNGDALARGSVKKIGALR
jgi:hypothetical protein